MHSVAAFTSRNTNIGCPGVRNFFRYWSSEKNNGLHQMCYMFMFHAHVYVRAHVFMFTCFHVFMFTCFHISVFPYRSCISSYSFTCINTCTCRYSRTCVPEEVYFQILCTCPGATEYKQNVAPGN
jgi:hypothetical protein